MLVIRDHRLREHDQTLVAAATPALEDVAAAYRRCLDEQGKPPTGLTELRPFLRLQTLVPSLRSGSLVVRYGLEPGPDAAANGRTVLAFLRAGSARVVPAVMLDGQVKALTAAELEEALQ